MININDIAQFLDDFFAIERFGDDQNGVYLPSTRAVARLGLGLEPWSELAQWVHTEQLDALFLHRPWQLSPEQLPPDIGVLAYHLAFDECLTLGFNPRLATVLGMSTLEVLGIKQGRPIGMLGNISPQSFAGYSCRIGQIFAGKDVAVTGIHPEVSRIAVVGAMTDILVREAAAHGADLYITGQLRSTAQAAVQETGIAVIAVGHRRCEVWGLQALAGILRDRYFELEAIVAKL